MNTLNYSEITQSFGSFLSYNPKWYLNFGNHYYSISDDNKLLLHNSLENANYLKGDLASYSKSYIKFIVSDDYQLTKVFDNVLYSADFTNLNNFTSIFFRTKTQLSSNVITPPTSITTTSQSIKYGRLYSWYAASDSRGLAPVGWHIPTKAEWQTLLDYAGGIDIAGGKLKRSGTDYWHTPNVGATNDYGFNALPSGLLEYDGTTSGYLGSWTQFWTSTTQTTDTIYDLYIYGYTAAARFDSYNFTTNKVGLSIRLIKDDSVNSGDIVIDGDTYNAVTIGTQVWLKQNLATSHYRNGDAIGSDFSGTSGAVTAYNGDESNVYLTTITTITTGAVSNITLREDTYKFAIPRNNVQSTLSIKYGRLYNWYAATNSRGLAPTGWHVATKDDWQTLFAHCGGTSLAGGRLKESGVSHWLTPDTGATDQYGFSALPGGCWSGGYFDINQYAHFISSTYDTHVYIPKFLYNSPEIDESSIGDRAMLLGSVRLVKDNSINDGDVTIDGLTYNPVVIGTQIWLKQNLSTRIYNDGTPIGTDFYSTNGAVAVYNNDPTYEGTPIISRFQDRMRGKYLICNYEFNNSEGNFFTLPYIETTYRYSMI